MKFIPTYAEGVQNVPAGRVSVGIVLHPLFFDFLISPRWSMEV
nr:MAG TPA: hypothetical protein [Caudoviricetes sp.]